MPLTSHPLDENAHLILDAHHADPFSYLGPHQCADGSVVVRALQPFAHTLDVVLKENGETFCADLCHSNGLFEAKLPASAWGKPYELVTQTQDGKTHRQADAYAFGQCLGELDMHLFREGKHWLLFEHLGAHTKVMDGVAGMQFAVWAPNARRVSVIGDFNSWDGRVHSMRCRIEAGIWEIFIPGVGIGAHYKFELIGASGELFNKSDPFAFFSQHGIQTSSLTWDYTKYIWRDAAWMEKRLTWDPYHQPMCIYEVHL